LERRFFNLDNRDPTFLLYQKGLNLFYATNTDSLSDNLKNCANILGLGNCKSGYVSRTHGFRKDQQAIKAN
jgi:hypothetical protein